MVILHSYGQSFLCNCKCTKITALQTVHLRKTSLQRHQLGPLWGTWCWESGSCPPVTQWQTPSFANPPRQRWLSQVWQAVLESFDNVLWEKNNGHKFIHGYRGANCLWTNLSPEPLTSANEPPFFSSWQVNGNTLRYLHGADGSFGLWWHFLLCRLGRHLSRL